VHLREAEPGPLTPSLLESPADRAHLLAPRLLVPEGMDSHANDALDRIVSRYEDLDRRIAGGVGTVLNTSLWMRESLERVSLEELEALDDDIRTTAELLAERADETSRKALALLSKLDFELQQLHGLKVALRD
jgi:hypothetical protein